MNLENRGGTDDPPAVRVPLINPNEPEARLSDLAVTNGDHVDAGTPLCTLETTKATSELAAETAGYIAGLHAQVGETVRAGDILCYLAPDPDWGPPVQAAGQPDPPGTEAPAGLRITRPAMALAYEKGLDLDTLPRDVLVTEALIRTALAAELPVDEQAAEGRTPDPRAVIVYGGGGHGKAVIELLRATGAFNLVGLVDDGMAAGAEVLGVPVLGGGDRLAQIHASGVVRAVNAVGGIEDIRSRVRVFERLSAGRFELPAVVHPSAVVEPSARLADGVQVFPLAYIGSSAVVGFGVIVNTGAIVSHDCELADYANLSPGAILAGGVRVGERALVGMGATINLGVQIGAGARIGNGATVKADVPVQGVVKAGAIWPPD